MGLRDLQSLAAAPESAASLTLHQRVQAVRATCAGGTFAVLKDLETELAVRDGQIAALQKNYEGLHTICEGYHEELDRLRAGAVEKLQVQLGTRQASRSGHGTSQPRG